MIAALLPLVALVLAAPAPPDFEALAAQIERGELQAAEPVLREAAEQGGSVRAMLLLGRLETRRRDIAAAADWVGKAAALAPNAEEVLSAQAQVALAARAPLPALMALDPLTRIAPREAQYHYLRGVALMQGGDMLAATESLTRAEALEPSRPMTLVALALAFNSRKMYDDARAALLRALEREPENLEALAALAEAEEGLGDLESAARHAGRVLAGMPGHATANLAAGMVHLKQGRYAEARDHLERARDADPTSPKAYYQLSLAYARLGDEAAASRNVEAYRGRLAEIEERLNEIRNQTGLPSSGGMRP